MDGGGGWRAARRRERVWIWRHEFPCCAGGIHSAPADGEWEEEPNYQPGQARRPIPPRQTAIARRRAARRHDHCATRRAPASLAKRRGRRTRAVHRAARRSRPARTRTHRHRLCGRRRSGGQIRQSAEGHRSQSTGGLESAALARRIPRQRSGAQSGVPLSRPRLAISEHAAYPRRGRADRPRDLRGSRPHHDAAARQTAKRFCFHRSGGCQCGCQSGRRSAPDRDYAARRAGSRFSSDAAARGVRDSARYDHGPQLGRIRRASGRGRHAVRGCPGSRERTRPRNDARLDGR